MGKRAGKAKTKRRYIYEEVIFYCEWKFTTLKGLSEKLNTAWRLCAMVVRLLYISYQWVSCMYKLVVHICNCFELSLCDLNIIISCLYISDRQTQCDVCNTLPMQQRLWS